MRKRDSGESGKKYVDGIWLNPKCCDSGQSASKPLIEEGSTTIPIGSRDINSEVVSIHIG